MSARLRLGLVVGAGVALRVTWAFAGHGGGWDIESLGLVRDALAQDPMKVYLRVNPQTLRWPYPPGYFAWVATAGWLASVTGLRFGAVIKLLPIAADAGIAILCYRAVLRHRRSDRPALAGAALVSFGPLFVTIAGYHGQLDAVAILPALAAIDVWERRGDRVGAALAAGLLIGVGVSIKTFPIVVLMALLPTARQVRHAGAAVAGAFAVPAAVTLPWLIADFRNVSFALTYRGGSGAGGLSLLLQPSLADGWFNAGSLLPNATTGALVAAAPALLALAVGTCSAVFVSARTPPLVAGLALFLAGYVFGVNFFMQYAVWGLAFAIAAGWLRSAFVVQLALLGPLVITYGARPWTQQWVNVPYTVILDLLWAACVVGLVALLRRQGAGLGASATRPQWRMPALAGARHG